MQTTRRLYNAAYRSNLEDEATPDEATTNSNVEDSATPSEDPTLSPQEATFKKRYADLRTYSNQLTERISQLETQLMQASKKEFKVPSNKEELTEFANKYPDVYRHIQTIAMTEILKERENIETETRSVKEDLSRTKKDLGLAKILRAHPDFEELNLSQGFHDWAGLQPKQVQDWLFESDDPNLCIKAIDFYKAEANHKKAKAPLKRIGADIEIPNKGSTNIGDGQKRVWKASEVAKLHPKEYERLEDEIDAARVEGRFDPSA